ncbi:MAG: hypothetical protein ABJA67_08905 [Chthonomonadales bacterium]
MYFGKTSHRACGLALAGLLFSGLSCAKAPPTTGSGTRLVVTVRFAGPINPTYHYFFLVRNAADSAGQNGPIPVILPPYGGNGFAAGKFPSSATAAFTDFVEFNRTDQPFVTDTGYTVYHVPGGYLGDPSRTFYLARGNPVASTAPGSGNVLQFELDLSQIRAETTDAVPNPDLRPRYLQVNIIAATTTPANSTTIDDRYAFDAIGDQRQSAGGDSFNSFITIDTTQVGKKYESTSIPGPDEPTGDSYPSDRDPAIDMTYWSIQITSH